MKKDIVKSLSGESRKAEKAREADLLNEGLSQEPKPRVESASPLPAIKKVVISEEYQSFAGPNGKGWC